MDLLYLDSRAEYFSVQQKLMETLGDQIDITDASDEIHTYRLEINTPLSIKEYFKVVESLKLQLCSFAYIVVALREWESTKGSDAQSRA